MDLKVKFIKIAESYLPLCITFCFIAMVIVPSSKFVNNAFYITVLIPGLFLIVCRDVTIINRLLLGVFAYILYVLVSSFWTEGYKLQHLKYFVYIVSFYGAIFQASTKSDFPTKYFFLWVGGAVLTLEIIWLVSFWFEKGFEVWMIKFPRVKAGGLSNPVYLSSILVICGLIFIQKIKSSILVKSLLIIVVFLFILPFQSRSSLLGLVIGGLAILSINIGRKRDIFYGLLFFTSILVIYNELSSRALNFTDDRWLIWKLAIESWQQDCSIFFGCGYGFEIDLLIDGEKFYHAHSIILSQLLYGGLVGFIFFITVFSIFLIKLFVSKSIYFAPVVSAFTILFFINNQILNSPNILWFIFWLPVFLGLIELQKNSDLKNVPIFSSRGN